MGLAELVGLVDTLGVMVARLEADCLSREDASRLADVFDRGERLCSAGKSLAAGRAASSGEWSLAGARSPEEWLADRYGTDRHAAHNALNVASVAGEQPALDSALRSGELSAVQAGEVAAAGAVDPSATPELIDHAKSRGLRGLKQECRQVANRANSAEDDRARAERLHRTRSLRMYQLSDGAGRVDGRLAPDAFARLAAALGPFEKEALDAARADGRREPFDAYRADALLAMAEAALAPRAECASSGSSGSMSAPGAAESPGRAGSATGSEPGPSSGPGRSRVPSEIVAVVDYEALRRGHALSGERSYIEGVGPVPVSVIKGLSDEAFLAAVVTDGVDIRSVVHLGRSPTRLQQSALRVRDPVCAVPGCEVTVGLQTHHSPEWNETHHTVLDELVRLCGFHHEQVTHQGATITGSPGQWVWTPPPPGPFDDPGPPGSAGAAGPFD